MQGSTNPILKKSWERSSLYGVDPITAKDAILDPSEFKQYREQKQSFLQEIYPTITQMFHWLRSSHSVVILSDTAGYILESLGDPLFLRETEKIHLSKGACWSERIRGTNAIGTVIEEQQPIEVVGKDHYLKANHILFCAASPIFNPMGDLIAVLDVSGFSEMHHPSLLGMVDTIARKIEERLLFKVFDHQLIVSLTQEDKRGQQALLAINEDGVITGANREARSLFGASLSHMEKRPLSDWFTGLEPLLGKSQNPSEQSSIPIYRKDHKKNKWFASVVLDTRPRFFPIQKSLIAKGKADKKNVAYYSFDEIYGRDRHFVSALHLARRAATTDYNVLVTGESGTGKEMVSQAIHLASHRRDHPFIAINCGAVSKSLMESELFGYEAGAFTGAKQSGQAGKIEKAHSGTLFLDEIAEMPLDMQVALLRVLQEFTVTRVGGSLPIPVDVRIIAATHKDLWQEVQAGRFRADLFFRLQGIHISIPPLRKREDRLQLADHLLQRIRKELGKHSLVLSTEASHLIETYPWPGNVRELSAALRHAAFLAESGTIDRSHFPGYILSGNHQPCQNSTDLLEQVEFCTIVETLKKTEGNVAQAARILGIGRNTLYRKLKKANL